MRQLEGSIKSCHVHILYFANLELFTAFWWGIVSQYTSSDSKFKVVRFFGQLFTDECFVIWPQSNFFKKQTTKAYHNKALQNAMLINTLSLNRNIWKKGYIFLYSCGYLTQRRQTDNESVGCYRYLMYKRWNFCWNQFLMNPKEKHLPKLIPQISVALL